MAEGGTPWHDGELVNSRDVVLGVVPNQSVPGLVVGSTLIMIEFRVLFFRNRNFIIKLGM